MGSRDMAIFFERERRNVLQNIDTLIAAERPNVHA